MKYTLENLFGIKNEVFLVSGGTGAIGFELCRGFLALGGKVGILGHSEKKMSVCGGTVTGRISLRPYYGTDCGCDR